MFERWVEGGLLDVLEREGAGCIPFSPLAQGLLTDKYLKGIPADSRAARPEGFLQKNQVTPEVMSKIEKLNHMALERGQTLAQMSLAWLFKDQRITSVLIGASRVSQLLDSLSCLKNQDFTNDELERIANIL